MGTKRRLIEIERHALGPRVYVCGLRVHEWQLGLAVVALYVVGAGGGVFRPASELGLVIVFAGGWLVAKDWRDVVPARRDSAAWHLGLHRPPAPLRTLRPGDSLPAVAAALAAVIGVANLVWGLSPGGSWLDDLVPQVRPLSSVPVFRSLAIPAGVCFILWAFNLRRRLRAAWTLALALLIVVTLVNLLQGLDLGETALGVVAIGLLWWGRSAFFVRPRGSLATAAGGVVGLGIGAVCFALAFVVVVVHSEPSAAAREGLDLLSWRTSGPVRLSDEAAILPALAKLFSLSIVLASACIVFRKPLAQSTAPGEELRTAAHALVRNHGSDTLSFFKLRKDIRYLFTADRRAFLGYRVEAGVLLMCGDPVGAPSALPELLRSACSFAEEHGLRLAALGASADLLPLYEQAGLRPFYLGDEAIVETSRFSLDGRAIRKVRQAVSRLEKAGYDAALEQLGSLSPADVAELERVSESWRVGRPERGFSMALDALRRDEHAETLVMAARDAGGTIRGFLHFVPAYGRPTVSLSAMRFERQTPNGLTEFMTVKSIQLLRERGVSEVSLNFAAFAGLMHRPQGVRERLLGRVVRVLNPYFQIESLYRFNAKFSPRWEPRYLVYEGRLGLLRGAVAALWAEGQLPQLWRRPARQGH